MSKLTEMLDKIDLLDQEQHERRPEVSKQHPYPQWISDILNDAIVEHYKKSHTVEAADDTVGDAALQALWDASLIVDIDVIPDHAVYMNDLGGIGFVGADRDTCMVDHMERVIYWGDDESADD